MQSIHRTTLSLTLGLVLVACFAQAMQFLPPPARVGPNQLQMVPITVNETIETDHELVNDKPLRQSNLKFDVEVVKGEESSTQPQLKMVTEQTTKPTIKIIPHAVTENLTTTGAPTQNDANKTSSDNNAMGLSTVSTISTLIIVASSLMASCILMGSQFSGKINL